jgi:hypothetical protein
MAKLNSVIRAISLPRRPPPTDNESSINLATQRLNGGMITSIDPSDLPDEACVRLVNGRVRYDRSSRRNGFLVLAVNEPNSGEIRKLILSRVFFGKSVLLRVTQTSIHKLGIASWIAISGTPNPIGKYIDSATVFNRIIIADGTNKLIYIYNGAVESAPEAPIAKFVTGFYNRVVSAHRVDASDGSITVYWSAEFEPGDPVPLKTWNLSTNIGAGYEPLIDSPGDVGDQITGIRGFANILVIPREKSIWLANKQASNTAPFRFYNALPGTGCDCSNAIEISRDGMIFADTRTKTMYVLNPAGGMDRFSVNVETDLFAKLGKSIDARDAYASFDAFRNEYHFHIPDGSTSRNWVFNFDTKAFSYDESALIQTLTSRLCTDKPLVIGTTIGELTGTIGYLTGTIGGLDDPRSDAATIYVGDSAGNIYIDDDSYDDDDGDAYNFIYETKDFTAQPDYDIDVRKLLVESNVDLAASMKLEWSSDSGSNWNLYRDWFTVNAAQSKITVALRNIHGRRIRIRITVRSGRLALLKLNLDALRGGLQSDNSA